MDNGTSAPVRPAPDDVPTRPFDGASPYDAYVRASVLNNLQHPSPTRPTRWGSSSPPR
ncbi:tryptophan 2,3-dioxygenase [Streptomyces laurentii]|uniref:Tryptophan 2,3-dioxygenase n=1 Tax=Streptomyces laurentii TaxID=39478 RepID=A0A160NUU9_STRLU|nr:tryptophan 2,3-dioxygenase [Streptomyces laurentii]